MLGNPSHLRMGVSKIRGAFKRDIRVIYGFYGGNIGFSVSPNQGYLLGGPGPASSGNYLIKPRAPPRPPNIFIQITWYVFGERHS